jgi:hypothetical protein
MCIPEPLDPPRAQMMSRDLDDETLGRCEAQALGSPAVAADPYAAWLQQRESERLEERPAIRWVYRNEIAAGRIGGGGIGGTRDASRGRSPGTEDGLVGVA